MRDFELENYFSKWEFAARYHLTASDIQSFSIAELLEFASDDDRRAFEQLWLGYTETYGAPLLRDAIANTYEQLERQHVLCFAGAEEGVYVAMRTLLKAQDHAIVVVPNYQAAETLPLQICQVSGVPLQLANEFTSNNAPISGGRSNAGPVDDVHEWVLDINKVVEQIKPNTRVISINFPNNPTGALMPVNDYLALIEICSKHGIYLFSDEVYRLTEHDPDMRLPQAADAYERGVSLNVMSKAYGLPGLRIGWIGCQDTKLLAAMERYKHYLSICNSGPSEQLALIALRARDQILARNGALLASNRIEIDSFFKQHSSRFEWHAPPASCVAFPRYLGPGETNEFCEKLVEQTGVLLLPPKVYHSELLPTPQDRFRVGFGRTNLTEALHVFGNYLASN